MTYALQNAVRSGRLRATQEFKSKYKGDAVADKPVRSPWAACICRLSKPNDAIRYFNESLAIYPKGRLAGLSVIQKATRGNQPWAIWPMRSRPSRITWRRIRPPRPSRQSPRPVSPGSIRILESGMRPLPHYNAVKTNYPGNAASCGGRLLDWESVLSRKATIRRRRSILDTFAKANPKNELAPLALYAERRGPDCPWKEG